MSSNLEKRFHDAMIASYRTTGEATGYWANRWLQKVRRDGGLPAAKEWLKPTRDATVGLERLAKEGRIDLSLEAMVLEEPWRQLFTADELNVAEGRLARFRKS